MAHDKPSLAKAEARYMRVSAQKARLVVDMIRGRQAGDAINILGAVNKRIAPAVEKVLRSAIANAETLHEDVDVDQKRIRPAPMGRAYRYQRRMSHIVVKVGAGPEEVAE
jgi:large subunit ribosomal protein L22